MHYLHYIITFICINMHIYNLSVLMTCRRLFQDLMEMLLQMALFSEDFVLSKTRFSLLIFFLLYKKLYCCLFTLTVMHWLLAENCDLL